MHAGAAEVGVHRDTFSLVPEAAQILKNVGSFMDVGLALKMFCRGCHGFCPILKGIGCSSVEVGTVLRDLFYRDEETADSKGCWFFFC
jgi:hypothetical protein